MQLCLLQTIALILLVILIAISLYILPNIVGSYRANNKLKNSRRFHIPLYFRWMVNPNQFHVEDQHNDMAIDLEVTYPHAILTVDEPMRVSAEATITENFPDIKTILIAFKYAQPYPVAFDETGIIKKGVFYLTKSTDNKMVGATKLSWPLEGKYKPGVSIELVDGKQMSSGEQDECTITVYPKSEVAQIASNKAIIDLTLAAYIIGAFGALNIIYQLWIST